MRFWPMRQTRCERSQSNRTGLACDASHSLRPIALEINLAAGPRKGSDSPIELGEDAGGIIDLGSRILFWLADGTSNCAAHAGFSSRRFAQLCGIAIQRAATGFFCPGTSDDVGSFLKVVLRRLKADCTAQILEWWRDADELMRESLWSAMEETSDLQRRICNWSTTLVFGIIDRVDESVVIWNLGDCAAVIYDRGTVPIDVPGDQGRLFLKMALDERAPLPLVHLIDREDWKPSIVDSIQSFVVFTDGNVDKPGPHFGDFRRRF